MKIVDVKVLGRALPMTLVELHSDAGLIGIGGTECPIAITRPIIERGPWNLAKVLHGRDVVDLETLAAELFRATLAQGGPVANAMGALDMALWDLAGKARNQPLHAMLGRAVRPDVPLYASATAFDVSGGLHYPLRFKSTERLVGEARQRVAEGFGAIKFGWGNRFAPEDFARISAIREAIGPGVRLMLDLGGPDYFDADLSPQTLAALAQRLAKFDLFFLEEPLPPYAVEAYAELSRGSRLRIATGEMLCHAHEFDLLIDARACHVVQPDAYRIGVTATAHVARRAAAAGISCVPHSPWSALAIAAHVNILATTMTGILTEYPSPSLFTDTARHGAVTRLNTTQIVTHPLVPTNGAIPLPARPGLGVGHFNYDAIAEIERLATEGLER
jgi:D-galactarolactone cycloisomerase